MTGSSGEQYPIFTWPRSILKVTSLTQQGPRSNIYLLWITISHYICMYVCICKYAMTYNVNTKWNKEKNILEIIFIFLIDGTKGFAFRKYVLSDNAFL